MRLVNHPVETTSNSNFKVIKVSVSTSESLSALEWDSNMERNRACAFTQHALHAYYALLSIWSPVGASLVGRKLGVWRAYG